MLKPVNKESVLLLLNFLCRLSAMFSVTIYSCWKPFWTILVRFWLSRASSTPKNIWSWETLWLYQGLLFTSLFFWFWNFSG